MLRIALACFVALLGLAAAAAQSPQVTRIEIVETGIFEEQGLTKVPDPAAPTGWRVTVKRERLIEATTKVPGRVGISFGFRYDIIGPRPREFVSLKFVTIFPVSGLRNPKTNKTLFQSESIEEVQVGAPSYRGYGFDEAWEVVPGTWVLEVWQGNRKLVEQTFNVYRP